MENELKEAIKSSGNNLHINTANYLEKKGWAVNLSSYYYDDTTDKPREIDIIASKKYNAKSSDKNSKTAFEVLLFIECKNFNGELAFRMLESDEGVIENALILEKFEEIYAIDKDAAKKIILNGHHYITEFTGRLYDTKRENNQAIFNAVTQPVKALIFHRDQNNVPRIYYPIVVYSGISGIYMLKGEDAKNIDSYQKKPETETIFELNYSYRNIINGQLQKQRFFVDFVEESKLNELINKIEKEAFYFVHRLEDYLGNNSTNTELSLPQA